MVDDVIDFEDDDVGSATNALIKVKKMHPSDEIVLQMVEIEVKTIYLRCL